MGKKKSRIKNNKQMSTSANEPGLIDENNETIAAALCSRNQAILIKVCRLCETKDGPFLNIYDADKVIAEKIQDLMPFVIAEYDDLPHKICFRCSAKVEELHEFVQKCVKTQENLLQAMGRTGPVTKKNNEQNTNKKELRKAWEDMLSKSNMSNDDICDAVIKKAMEGIKDLPIASLSSDEEPASVKRESERKRRVPEVNYNEEDIEEEPAKIANIPLKKIKLSLNKCDDFTFKKSLRKYDTAPAKEVNEQLSEKPKPENKTEKEIHYSSSLKKTKEENIRTDSYKEESVDKKEKNESVKAKPFDIKDHISMVKVNGVGVLFQCSICNRNFLQKDIIMTHACAKNGVPKDDFTKHLIQRKPQKPPTVVKYINTREEQKPLEKVEPKADVIPVPELVPIVKPKPKIGPASKVKRQQDSDSIIGTVVHPRAATPPPATPTVQFPNKPNTKCSYKLVPGPNNTFTLVEDQGQPSNSLAGKKQLVSIPIAPIKPRAGPKSKTRQATVVETQTRPIAEKVADVHTEQNPIPNNSSQTIPYPVGLFQTIQKPAFSTPAMKKQNYTVVQTGNPSKLLISTKPQPAMEQGKKNKKNHETKHDKSKKEHTVTAEDASRPKNDPYFTFINVDPLLQPSYVLPTTNMIQESQISTSTAAVKNLPQDSDKGIYSCNMCGEGFSREKKLLAHIQSHYNRMDEEDEMRSVKVTAKRRR